MKQLRVADKQDVEGKWIKSYTENGTQYLTNSYARWRGIINRCKPGAAQAQSKCYVGCSVSPLFEEFQGFANWYTKQVGYGLEDYDIDKDLLVKGNKLYSEETCVLIPAKLNKFLSQKNANSDNRGIAKTATNRYVATGCLDSNVYYIGTYDTSEEARTHYLNDRNKNIGIWIERLKDMVIDSKVITALYNLSSVHNSTI